MYGFDKRGATKLYVDTVGLGYITNPDGRTIVSNISSKGLYFIRDLLGE